MLVSPKVNKEFDVIGNINAKQKPEHVKMKRNTTKEEHTALQILWNGTSARTMKEMWQNM